MVTNRWVHGIGRRTATLLLVAAVSVAAGCSSADTAGDADRGGTPTSASPASASPAPTTIPPASMPPTTMASTTMREAMTLRLSSELDEATADTVMAALSDEVVSEYDRLVGIDAAASSPALAFRAESVDDESVSMLLAFAFGNRPGPDGTTVAGPTNAQIAERIAEFVKVYPVPVYAQWEIADELGALGVDGVVSIGVQTAADGTVTYLSTKGVAEQAFAQASSAGIDTSTVGIVGFIDHEVRCLMTARAVGFDGGAPAGMEPVSSYDESSAQEWTRDRASYIATDLIGRTALLG